MRYPHINLSRKNGGELAAIRGRAKAARGFRTRGMSLVIRRGWPGEVIIRLAGRAALVVCDLGYLCSQKA
ncbi:MAG: hypothetical protein JO266_01865 [Acidobacteria bacterium]|nr:hypothetical protein [Acidobacteriota bacterium]MBV9483727.1 hypothetical protein [Acidobacteriota bacterium]